MRAIAVLPHGDSEAVPALLIAGRLRAAGLTVDFSAADRFGRRMKWANRINASHVLIVGSDELQRGVATVRDMDSGAQEDVPLDRLETFFATAGAGPD
jgi:histidyl-tRNA synthetase